MHDIRAIRADPAGFDVAMARRGGAPVANALVATDIRARELKAEIQDFATAKRKYSDEIGRAKREGLPPPSELGLSLRENAVKVSELALETASREIAEALERLPNILDAEVPDGTDETANAVLSTHGTPHRPNPPTPEHFEIGERLGLMDFAAAAKLAGSRFTVLRGPLARLERVLGQWMLDLHTSEHGYTEIAVPLLVNEATMRGTGQLPKFKADLFETTDGRYLIPTAEVPLTNLAANEILQARDLPIRLTALTECFRSEAGSAGRDTRGMLRQHQFRKVELVSIVEPDQSADELERMTRCAETVLEKLQLPYRRLLLCAGDTGFAAARTHDLEVWLPGQQAWREISSCSNCRDFQARRMNARVRAADGKTLAHVHTLNGSGVAIGRALIGVLETFVQVDGTVLVPRVLQDRFGADRIAAKA